MKMHLWKSAQTSQCTPKPKLGMSLAFKADSSQPLSSIPGTVVFVWPRFRSGDYLVTLQFAEPVPYERRLITQIDVFMSELEPVKPATTAPAACMAWLSSYRLPR